MIDSSVCCGDAIMRSRMFITPTRRCSSSTTYAYDEGKRFLAIDRILLMASRASVFLLNDKNSEVIKRPTLPSGYSKRSRICTSILPEICFLMRSRYSFEGCIKTDDKKWGSSWDEILRRQSSSVLANIAAAMLICKFFIIRMANAGGNDWRTNAAYFSFMFSSRRDAAEVSCSKNFTIRGK